MEPTLKLECRLEAPLEEHPACLNPRDVRHDLASVASALHTLRASKRVYLGDPAPEILDLSLAKLYRAIDALDGWLEASEKH